ncbi:hypothetical protein TrLO_g8056 [Triparma laevis f. longispina]|uniref:Uncharacterized protein n=1 Tax=Triparma laevis f. longispina TaxID=1714387 RepID=A0A9W7CHU9_9STRA|nr:hypothetical protein TrLO_g8056 [Triparma laevis f. longispina]
MSERALYKKGDVCLYELKSGSNQFCKASIMSVHLDDDPPYYTIRYTAFEPDTSAPPPASRSSLSGSGAVLNEKKETLKPVRHEKQTIQARLKPIPDA